MSRAQVAVLAVFVFLTALVGLGLAVSLLSGPVSEPAAEPMLSGTVAPSPEPSRAARPVTRGPMGGHRPLPPGLPSAGLPGAGAPDAPPPFAFLARPGGDDLASHREAVIAGVEVFIARLWEEVDLSEDQVEALTEVLQAERMDEFDTLHPADGEDEVEDPRELLQAIRDESDAAAGDILDERQRAAYEALRRPATSEPEVDPADLPE